MNDLLNKKCKPCEGGIPGLTLAEAKQLTVKIPGWTLDEATMRISRSCHFKNYYETMAFVNAIAWISHREDHHPDLEVSYNRCVVQYSTHAVKGLTETTSSVRLR